MHCAFRLFYDKFYPDKTVYRGVYWKISFSDPGFFGKFPRDDQEW